MTRHAWLFTLTLTALFVIAATTPTMAQEAVTDSVRKYKFLGKSARDKSDHADVIIYYDRLLTFKSDYHLAHYYKAAPNWPSGTRRRQRHPCWRRSP